MRYFKKLLVILFLSTFFLINVDNVYARNYNEYLKHYYPLDFNARDVILDYTGGETAIAYTYLKMPDQPVALFDGVDSVIDTGSEWVDVGEDSFSAWIKPFSLGENNRGRIIDNGKTIFYIGTGNELRFTSDGVTEALTNDDSIAFNMWQHVLVTRNSAGGSNLYINGVLSTFISDMTSGTPEAGTTFVEIGNNSNTDSTFDGNISDIKYWETELTGDEAKQEYLRERKKFNIKQEPHDNLPDLADQTLVAAYLNKATTLEEDYSVNDNYLTGSNNGVDGLEVGGDFDGDASSLNETTGSPDFIGVSALTVTGWFKIRGWGAASTGRIVDNARFGIVFVNTGKLLSSSDGYVTNAQSAADSVILNQWHHFMVTRTATGVTNFYIDGVLSGTADQPGDADGVLSAVGATAVYIGNRAAQDRGCDGIIKDLRFYTEVKNANFANYLYKQGVFDDSLILAVQDGNEELSRFNRSFTASNMESTGVGMSFNDSTSNLDFGDVDLFTDSGTYTIICCVRPDTITGTDVILSKWNFLGDKEWNYGLYQGRQFLITEGQQNIGASDADTAVTANEVAYLAATYNAGTVHFYLNGLSDSLDITPGHSITAGAANLHVGAQESSGVISSVFDGKIYWIKVYDEVKSQSFIKYIIDTAISGS